MQKGDLAEIGLADVLSTLAEGAATGCVHVEDPVGARAQVFLRSGRVYAATAPGRRPSLGERLLALGVLTEPALDDALQAQREELQGWRLSELLVHLGLVERPDVEPVVRELVREAVLAVLPWAHGTWRLRAGEKTRDDVAEPVEVAELVALAPVARTPAYGPGARPVLSAAGTSPEQLQLDPDAWALLCSVDGVRTLAGLAVDRAEPLHTTGLLVGTLLRAGLVEVEAEAEPEDDEADDPALVTSLSRVSLALSVALGPSPLSAEPLDGGSAPLMAASPVLLPEQPHALDAARRDNDAAELAAAQAELEAARTLTELVTDEEPADELSGDAVVMDLGSRREARDEHGDEHGDEAGDEHAYEQGHQAGEGAAEEAGEEAEADRSAFAAELSATAQSAPDEPVPAEPGSQEVPAQPGPAPAAGQPDPHADTASLLRELASLGLGDQPVPPPRPAPAPRPVAPSTPAPVRRRKGLFGRH